MWPDRTIRPAAPEDAAALRELYRMSLQEASWVPPGSEPAPDFAAASQGEKVFVCISAEGDLLGFVGVWEPESFLHHLYVDARFQRQGVGAALLRSLESWLPKPWRLKCVQANHQALAFYQANGWRPIEEGQGRHGPYYLMEKR